MIDDVARLRGETPGVANRIHLNNAGASLMPAPVLLAMIDHLRLEADIGGYEAAELRSDDIAEFYRQVGALIGSQPENVAFTASATDAFARALSSVPFLPGDTILTTRDDYISNQIAFFSLRKRSGVKIVHAPSLPEGGVDLEAMAVLMRRHRPRLVAVTHIPTNSGLVQPVAEIGTQCRELDLLYLVDACQSAGQYVLAVQRLGCDFLSGTFRKFLRGPRGSGFLYVSDRALDAGYEPLFIDMRGARWSAPDAYDPVGTAARFEEWESPYAALLGAAAAVKYALGVGVERIAKRTPALGMALRDALTEVPGVTILDRGHQRCAIVTLTIAGWPAQEARELLSSLGINSSVSLREYARYDFDEKGVDSCLRLSPHYYNTDEEINAAVEAITGLARQRCD
jgi:selenocysteine lyase/cysteine desulfurase